MKFDFVRASFTSAFTLKRLSDLIAMMIFISYAMRNTRNFYKHQYKEIIETLYLN